MHMLLIHLLFIRSLFVRISTCCIGMMAIPLLHMAQSSPIIVNQFQSEFPVLKNTSFNHVLLLEIFQKDTIQKTTIEEIVLETGGTANLEDLKELAIYYVGSERRSIHEKALKLAQTTAVTGTISLSTHFQLPHKRNFLWISYTLKEGADILHKVSSECIAVRTHEGKAQVNTLEQPHPLRMGIAVRKHGDDGVNVYRIPGLVTTPKGTLLACYDVRRDVPARDLQGDIDIGISRSTDGGNSWEPMRIGLDQGEWGGLAEKFNGVSDACLLVDSTSGTIYLAGLWMHGVINQEGEWIENLTEDSTAWNHQWRNKGSQAGWGMKETSQFLIAKSVDDGKSWGEVVNITEMCKRKEWWLLAPAPGKGITLKDGTLVFPTQGRDETGESFSNITYSQDGGNTWITSSPAYTNTTECAVVQLNDGTLMLNMRDNRNRKDKSETNGRAIAITKDLGNTWQEHTTSHAALIEPVCMASLFKVGSTLFFANPNSKFKREHITVKVSLDQGNSWPSQYWLMVDEGQGRGYSCLTLVDDETLGILYESSQADLVFQKIPLTEFPSAK